MAEITGYTRLQILLHWLIVALVLVEYGSSDGLEHNAGTVGGLALAHVWTGVVILALMALRLIVRLIQGAPEPPASEREILRKIAVWTQWAFYALLILIPLGGVLDWYGGIKAGLLLHDIGEGIFFILVWVHVAAAFAHQFIFRTDVVRRMLLARR